MNNPVIFIDDEQHVRDALAQTLEIEDYTVSCFSNAIDALKTIDSFFSGVIISDINMPMMDGLEFLKKALTVDPDLQIIMLTGHGDISMAVDAMRAGAYDFLEKPFSTDHLLDVVKRASDKRSLVLENRELRKELEAQSGPGPRILGNNEQIKQLRRILGHIKDSTDDVMVQGEPGSGKALVARFLHDHSQRHIGPFVTLNCHTIPSHLIASELFGYDTITQTSSKQQGKLINANGGTLFINGLDLLPSDVQTKLINILTTRTFKAHNGQLTDLNVRIIAASSANLTAALEVGTLNQALYYQLNAINIMIPSLKERKDDILMLFKNFARDAATRYGIEPPAITPTQQNNLLQHDWPGNVRELKNFAERMVLMGETPDFNTHSNSEEDSAPLSLAKRIDRFELTLLSNALNRHNGRLKEVQEEFGLARKTLYDKMKKHGLNKDDFKP
ncbi:sigma-54 dependent transcriptional regulator [Vibrio sp. Of7-15]|uniref:sigma-54-dependent transcriptional regulator n=1 Tax=Vibrio sp. Of7-15 TaxID=2724879 RepID=UPI001EF3A118|nr:sigma-54 dependent transcriptional regulator [Vibrio sp. Of7-15]